MRKINKEAFSDYNFIMDGIYLGSINAAKDEELLIKLKIESILTVDIYSLPENIIKSVKNYLHINIKDDKNENLLEHLNVTNNFIQKCLLEKKNLLIHCVAGISRSSSVLIGYLMKTNKINFEQAFKIVCKQRNKICCNEGFKMQLNLYSNMNWVLDINNRIYRVFAIKQLSRNIKYNLTFITNQESINSLNSLLNDYFIKFHEDSKLNSGKIIFKCKKCRLYLFNEINILNNIYNNINSFKKDEFINIISNKCNAIYIEPMKWMLNELTCMNGILTCKNCFSKLGSYSWQGINCMINCETHKNTEPSFKVDLKKIDHHFL